VQSGSIAIVEGEKLWESVRRLTNKHEKHSEHPVSLDSLPPSVQQQMSGIIGFEISINKLEAAFKISQNRNEEDYRNIIEQLRVSPHATDALMAEVMERARKGV
jgi:transcriptional regulator